MSFLWLPAWQTAWVKDGDIFTAVITGKLSGTVPEYKIAWVHITHYNKIDIYEYTRRSHIMSGDNKDFLSEDAERAFFDTVFKMQSDENNDIVPEDEGFFHGFFVPTE